MDKLKDDPIVEALLEVQFEAPELQEVVVGRLSDLAAWKTAKKVRLPVSDIPGPIRAAEQALRFQPTIEIQEIDGIGAVRVGGNVISLHFLRPYAGWLKVFPILRDATQSMFAAIPQLKVTRLGLRYINAFTPQRHYVHQASDLALRLSIADAVVDHPINLTVYSTAAPTHGVQTRVASPHFLKGKLPNETAVVVDVDVFTLPEFSSSSVSEVNGWIDQAHTFEKQVFRKLIPNDLYAKLMDGTNVSTH